MNRKDYIKQAITLALKQLNKEKPGWLYSRSSLRQVTATSLDAHITETEFTEALEELKKEKKIHRVTTYS